MKKFGFVLVLLALFMVLIASTASASTLLRYGSVGSEVSVLQTNLNQLGYPVGAVDGQFGSRTKGAVINLQKGHGLTADGVVGSLTQGAIAFALHPVSTPTRQQRTDGIIATAKSMIGIPYLWGGMTAAGFDCSGFTQYVFKANGVSILRVSRDQANNGNEVAYSNLQAGDLMFFSFLGNGVVSHVVIYIGNNQFIGAESSGVKIVTLSDYWKTRFIIARRAY